MEQFSRGRHSSEFQNLMVYDSDTICALSTPLGIGGIAVIRVSGPRALPIVEGLFRYSGTGPLDSLPSHTVHYGHLFPPDSLHSIDEVLLLIFRAPRSYTTEEMVEIHCHGGTMTVNQILKALLSRGCRLARPGEFTLRAFLNGRMDLTQAEAVMDVISSGNEAGRKAAFHQLQGGLSREIEEIREKVLSILVPLEAFIDFPEEEISFSRAGSPGGFKTALADLYRLRERIGRLVRSFDQGRVLREGLATAIIGRPNVGKSSLLNSLLGEDRAIVTPHPGTTRDTLEEVVQVDGIPLRITDTAGIREAVDPAEEEGIRRAKRALEGADLVLLILDASTDLLPEDDLLLEMTCGKRTIMVLNKCDLGERDWTREKGLERGLVFRVSVLHHQGMDGLKKGISRYVREVLWGQEAETETPIVTRLRHREALERANQGLGEFIAKAETPSITLDILAFHLRFVLDSLGEIVGAITPEGLLDRIFSEFCIGK